MIRRVAVVLAASGALAGAAPTALGAQAVPLSSVSGRVLLAGADAEPRGLPGRWVALNRVGSDAAGVLDSVRSGADGSYRFTFRRSGDPEAIYFTDVTYGGVGYFTDPLRALNTTGDEADLIVFDTVHAVPAGARRLRVRGRHFVVGPATAGGRRPIVEVFELTNDTSLTIVPPADSIPVWSTPLVAGAEDAAVGGGDLGAGVVAFRNGRAELHAPIAPGLRQLSVHYTVPGDAFPLVVSLADSHEVLEVLVAGDAGQATGAGLHPEGPVTIEEQAYRRFLSQRAAPGAEVVISVAGNPMERAALFGGLGAATLVLGAALVHARRTPYPSPHN